MFLPDDRNLLPEGLTVWKVGVLTLRSLGDEELLFHQRRQ